MPVDGTVPSTAPNSSIRALEMRTVLLVRGPLPDPIVTELKTFLSSRGFALVVSHGPLSLVDSLERSRAEALLIDAGLSGGQGVEYCRLVRTLPRWEDLPILFISADEDLATRIAAYEAGADDFIAAPLVADDFIARLGTRLERTRQQRERSDHDVLTGLLTRRAFMEHCSARLSEMARHNRTLAFCLIDIDHFKHVNDTYGHLAGDRVLEAFGELLRSHFRAEDLRARWGGEEFALVLVGADRDTACRALQRALDAFASIEFDGEEHHDFHVTFSAGVVQFPCDGKDLTSLLKAADLRLLAAKRRGRNQILYHWQTPPTLDH
jgi:diguanylate cyclase (GGDEF)-like protein